MRKTIRVANVVIENLILIIIVILLVFAAYAIWDSNQVFAEADSSNYEIYNPVNDEESPTFEELRSINPEVISWLTIYGTKINYPLVQGFDNMKYVNTNALGGMSLSGAIFLDYRNSSDFSDFNSILYGHHMEKGAMFGDIDEFENEAFFNANKYGNLYYGDKDYGIEIYAFIKTDAYDDTIFSANVSSEDGKRNYLSHIEDNAEFYRDIGVSIDDRLLVLTTCSTYATNGRYILATRITDEVFENVLPQVEEPRVIDITVVEKIFRFPMWLFTIGLPLLILIILAIVLYVVGKRKHNRRSN